MNTNDQWFNPGDHVMRVCYLVDIDPNIPIFNPSDSPKFGELLCVSHFVENTDRLNQVAFVGKSTSPVCPQHTGFYAAACFRRVDEIRLCVDAAKHIKQREEELV